MNLRSYFRVFRKRWKMIVSIVVLAVGVGLAVLLTTPPTYEATAQIFVATATTSDPSALASGNVFTQARVQSYTSVANAPSVTDYVVASLGLALTPEALAGDITADAPINTVLINITVASRSAQDSAKLTNAVAQRFTTVVEALEQTGSTQSPVKLTVTQPAQIPQAPTSPNTKLYLALALVVGLVVGIAAAFVREALDNTIKDPQELAELSGAPVLGVVPWDKRTAANVIAVRDDAHGSRAEAFRQFRTNLQFINVDSPPRIIAVTSALPGEAKTHTALNLAAALTEAGQRVCLVEADLRKPTLARLLGLVPTVGVTTLLVESLGLAEVLQNAGRNLAVLTSGALPPNPSELLHSDHFRAILDELATRVDVVIVDTAPLLPVADGLEVAAIADATILVVRSGKTSREQIANSLQQLANVGVRVTGVVLSMIPAPRKSDYNYYSYTSDGSDQTVLSADGGARSQ